MTMEVSPRISFSHDLPSSPTSSNPTRRIDDILPLDPPSSEFDFSTSYEVSLDSDISTPADLLFSHGKLLPLNNNNNNKTNNSPPCFPKPEQTINQILANEADNEKTQPLWYTGRSISVSGSGSSQIKVDMFPRSKSAGYSPNQNLYPTKNRVNLSGSGSGSTNAKVYHYRRTPYRNGVSINPVINVPASFIPRGGSTSSSSSGSYSSSGGGRGGGFFAYLLCTCRYKDMEMDENEGG